MKWLASKLVSRQSGAAAGARGPRPLRLMMAAAALHMALVLMISLAGMLGLFPDMIDSYGTAKFISLDAVRYRYDAAVQARVFMQRGMEGLLLYPEFFHTKLYALSFALFDPYGGSNLLSAEPANVFVYLLILFLVYRIGVEAFERRVGMLAAAVVALWPSFLLHTTQLLKEPQFVAAMLVLVLVSVCWLTRRYSLLTGAAAALAGGVALVIIWLVRGEVWEVSFLIVLLAGALLVARQIQEKRFGAGNMLGFALLLVLAFSIPRTIKRYNSFEGQTANKAALVAVQPASGWRSLPERISGVRGRFIASYPGAGSNIDTHVKFNSMGDILRYLPRAAAIGFFSPFPHMWFTGGTVVGLKGRLLSGAETLLMYLVELLAVYGLWCGRRRLSVWLLLAASGVGLVALGLVVINISALYRFRYAFWILLIILGVEGGLKLFLKLFSRESASVRGGDASELFIKV